MNFPGSLNAPQPPPLPPAYPPTAPGEIVLERSPNGPPFLNPLNRGVHVRTPWWLWLITLSILAVLVWYQRPAHPNAKRATDAAHGLGPIKPPRASEFVLVGKFIIVIQKLMAGAPSGSGNEARALVRISDQFAGWEWPSDAVSPSLANPPERPKGDDLPAPAADRLRAAIIAGEVVPPDELAWRLADVEKDLDPSSILWKDDEAIRILYGLPPALRYEPSQGDVSLEKVAKAINESPPPSNGAAAPTTLTQEQKDTLRVNHGWFAQLALSRSDPSSTLRDAAAGQGIILLIVLIVFGLLILVGGLTGLVLLILSFVRLAGGRWSWAFLPPRIVQEWPVDPALPADQQRAPSALATPGSVWLETVAVFFASFLAIKIIGQALHKQHVSDDAQIAFALAGQWAIALSIFWPILRGMSFARWKSDIGWRAPRGVPREVGAGILGYLAGLPVYFLMAIVVVLITLIIDAITKSHTKPQGNRIIDILESGAWWELVVVYLLATVWAPVVEESIFRGCLFRHLRRRFVFVLAGLGSAAVFAVLHGYNVQGLVMVATLGFWFALMREWRGSIIPSATAHAIHNGVVMALIMIVLSMANA